MFWLVWRRFSWHLSPSDHRRRVAWTWRCVHCTQTAFNRAPLGCGEMGDSQHRCSCHICRNCVMQWCQPPTKTSEVLIESDQEKSSSEGRMRSSTVLAGVPNKVSCIFLYFIIIFFKIIIFVSAVPHPVVLCIVSAHEKPTKTFSCFSLSPILSSSSSSSSSISWWSAELHFLTVLLFVPKNYNETKHRRSEIKSSLRWEESGQEYTHTFVLMCTVSMLYNSSLEAVSFIYNKAKN